MVNGSLGWKVLKIPFLLLAFPVALKRFDAMRRCLIDQRKSSRDFMFPKRKPYYFKCINKDAWDL